MTDRQTGRDRDLEKQTDRRGARERWRYTDSKCVGEISAAADVGR